MGVAAIPIAVGLQASESRKARKRAEREANRQRAEQEALLKEREKEQEEITKEEGEVIKRTQRAARTRQKARPRQTILTSPLGILDEPETEGKTLLGR